MWTRREKGLRKALFHCSCGDCGRRHPFLFLSVHMWTRPRGINFLMPGKCCVHMWTLTEKGGGKRGFARGCGTPAILEKGAILAILGRAMRAGG